jgi:hypothetical protein
VYRAGTGNDFPHSGQGVSFPAASSGTDTDFMQFGQISLITRDAS